MSVKGKGGRELFLEYINEGRKARLKENAGKYQKMVPANVRAAIARVAGVSDISLDQLSAKEREALYKAAAKLHRDIEVAYMLLVSTHTRD